MNIMSVIVLFARLVFFMETFHLHFVESLDGDFHTIENNSKSSSLDASLSADSRPPTTVSSLPTSHSHASSTGELLHVTSSVLEAFTTDGTPTEVTSDAVTSSYYDITSQSQITYPLYETSPLPHRYKSDDLVGGQTFDGEVSSADHFRVIHVKGHSMLVGARNVVYNISLQTLAENKRITWLPNEADLDSCRKRLAKTDEECQNYIRIIAETGRANYLVCGTNAFQPQCRHYQNLDEDSYNHVGTESGKAKVPCDPYHNNTAIYSDGRLYTATVADPEARDPVIFSDSIQTVRKYSQWLNEPNFVSSVDYEDKIYFFFREPAVEYINCGKAVFSRVARVCKNDFGGSQTMRMQDTWTSFFKARLNCSIPGEFPFYFDEIQATSELGEGNVRPTLAYNDRSSIIYGIFNTPQNSIPGSAVCAFKLSDIVRTFSGAFKEQANPTSLWLPVTHRESHPAKTCANDSRNIANPTLNFIKTHPLMDEAVPASGGRPVLVQASLDGYRMTAITVDWQFRAADQRFYDVLFLGTSNGHVLKAINKGRGEALETIIIEDIEVFETAESISKLEIYRDEERNQEKLIVITRDAIKSIPLNRCQQYTSCKSCVAAQDPYCAWTRSGCAQSSTGESIQSLESGQHISCVGEPEERSEEILSEVPSTVKPQTPSCPPCVCPTTVSPAQNTPTESNGLMDDETEKDTEENKELRGVAEACVEASTGRQDKTYTPQILAVATTVSTLLSLFVGFVLGYGYNIWRNRASPAEPMNFKTTNTEKVQNTYEVGPSNLAPRNDTKTPPPVVGEKQLNVVYNPLKNNGKTPNGNVETTVNISKSRKVYV